MLPDTVQSGSGRAADQGFPLKWARLHIGKKCPAGGSDFETTQSLHPVYRMGLDERRVMVGEECWDDPDRGCTQVQALKGLGSEKDKVLTFADDHVSVGGSGSRRVHVTHSESGPVTGSPDAALINVSGPSTLRPVSSSSSRRAPTSGSSSGYSPHPAPLDGTLSRRCRDAPVH